MIRATREQIENAKKEWEITKIKFESVISQHEKNYFQSIPKPRQRGWYDCFVGKASSRKAIKAKCLDCSNYQQEEVSKCTVKTCPLWNVRPWK